MRQKALPIWTTMILMVVLLVKTVDARPCDDCRSSRTGTMPTAQTGPPPADEQTVVFTPPPTDVDWLNSKRTLDNGTIIVQDPQLWPTGAMPWEVTVQLEGQLADWLGRYQYNPSTPPEFLGLATRDWETIEGHKQWLISLTAAESQAEEAATNTPQPSPQPTIVPNECKSLKEQAAAVLAEYNEIWNQIDEYEAVHGERSAKALRQKLSLLGEEYKRLLKEQQAKGCFGGR